MCARGGGGTAWVPFKRGEVVVGGRWVGGEGVDGP